MDSTPSPPSPSAGPGPSEAATVKKVIAGFATGLVAGSLPAVCEFLNNPFLISPAAAAWFKQAIIWACLFDIFIMPLVALVLIVIPSTRKFGLGFLLSAGLCWMWSFSICSRML